MDCLAWTDHKVQCRGKFVAQLLPTATGRRQLEGNTHLAIASAIGHNFSFRKHHHANCLPSYVHGDIQEWHVGNHEHTMGSGLTQWGYTEAFPLLCLPTAEPIALLTMRGMWHVVFALGRWACVLSQFPVEVKDQVRPLEHDTLHSHQVNPHRLE